MEAPMLHRFALVLALVVAATLGGIAVAGTTGALTGVVVIAGSTTPIVDARISVTSPSQTAVARTDATGHFSFVSLVPDTYTISVDKAGYEPIAVSGISIFADATQTVNL